MIYKDLREVSMCGIVGYIGAKSAVDILLEGLTNLISLATSL